MQKSTFRLGLAILVFVWVVCWSFPAFSFPPTSMIQGTWEININLKQTNWGEIKQNNKLLVTVYMYQTDYIPNQQNLKLVPSDDPQDFFEGIILGNSFVLFKQKDAQDNFGREMIIGTIKSNNKGMTMKGTGMGFDSNMDWGGRWSDKFTGRRISTEVP
jgi:hypothetical protein